MSAPSHALTGHSSEGHASACPQSEAHDVQKHVPPEAQDVQKHVPSERRHPIHLVPREVHNRPVIIFVTTCTAKRRLVLASASAHEAIVTAWCAASTWLVGRYVIMPDHIHLFCAPNALDAPSLERDTQAFVGALTDTELARTIAYTNFQGERWAYPLWQQMIHQVNHATQHRSEAAMLLTKLGHSPGWLDLLYFYDVGGPDMAPHTPQGSPRPG